ncbi:MAG: hypothetical protein WCO82_03420 [Sphingomonadales bacterium]|jgi:hypothetical protein
MVDQVYKVYKLAGFVALRPLPDGNPLAPLGRMIADAEHGMKAGL